MNIRITQTWAQIGINTQNARLEMRNNGKLDFIVKHTEPKVQIDSTLPKVHIDQSKAFADEGLKGIADFMQEAVDLGKKNAMEYTARKAQQGDTYAKIENKGKPILDAIKEELTNFVDYNVVAMPQHAPEIYVEEGETNIQAIEGQVETFFNYTPIESTFIPPEIEIYMKQKGSVSIEYVGNNVDTKI